MTEQLNINNLLPETDYVVQVRAVNDAGNSKWSQKFKFRTIDDTINGRKPKTPTGVTWTFSGTGFRATWNEVTHNTDNSRLKIVRYAVQLSHGGDTKIVQVAPDDGTITYNLPLQRAQSIFGTKNITTVSMRVRAVNASGNKSDWSALLSATAGIPDAPTNAEVEPIIDGIKLSWSAPADTSNVAGYRVYVGLTAGFTPGETNRIYQGTALTTTYNTSTYSMHYFKIRSYSAWGAESSDLTAQATPNSPFVLDTNPPTVPGGLSVVVDRSGAVARALVSWSFDESGDNADIQNFAIRYRKTGDPNWFMEFASNDVRSLYVNLPQPYANYEFQMASMDLTGNYSEWSSTVTLSSGIPGPPPQVTGLNVTPGFGDLNITWSQSSHDDVTYGGYYEVQIATDSGFSTNLLEYKVGNTSLAVAGLGLFTTYYVRVRAVDVEGNHGTYSTTWSGATQGIEEYEPTDGIAPASSPAAIITPGIGALFVSWTAVANADPVTYEVHISTTSGFTPNGGTLAARTPGTIITLRNTAGGAVLDYATTYYAKIIARDPDGAAAAGAQASGSPIKAGSGDITSIIADQIASSTMSTTVLTMGTSGAIVSSNYVADTSGYKLSETVVDIQSGKVNFGTLRAGTMTASNLRIGANGQIIVDSTGEIKSNNYNGSVGWRLGSSGLDAPGLTINAGNVYGDTIAGRALTVNSGGYIRSSSYSAPTSPNYNNGAGFNLDYTGLQVYGGSIYGPTIITNQLYSATHDANSPLSVSRPGGGGTYNPSFGINSAGKAVFSGAQIYGNTVLGSSSSDYIQSNSFSPSSGWRITGSGAAEFNNATISASTFRSRNETAEGIHARVGEASSATGSQGIKWYDSSNVLRAAITYQWAYGNSLDIFHGNGAVGLSLRGTVGQVAVYSDLSMNLGGIIMNGNNISMGQGNLTSVGSIGGGTSAINLNSNMNVSGQTLTGGLTFSGGLSGTGTVTFGTLTGSGSRNVVANQNGVISAPSSSLRYKENVRPLRKFERILDLDPIVYQYKDRAGYGDRLYAGFAAEQLDEVGLGVYVDYDNQGRPDNVRYSDMVTGLVALVRETRAEVVELRKTLDLMQEGS